MAEVIVGDYGGCLPVIFDDAFAYSDSKITPIQNLDATVRIALRASNRLVGQSM